VNHGARQQLAGQQLALNRQVNTTFAGQGKGVRGHVGQQLARQQREVTPRSVTDGSRPAEEVTGVQDNNWAE
jgi:hypothetical protein